MTKTHPAEELAGKYMIFVWRLTLTCGHLKLWGPFTDGPHEKYVGDHTSCDVCPQVGKPRINQFQLIVNAEPVNPYMCSPDWLRSGLEGVIG